MEKVTPHQLLALRDAFFDKVEDENPDFCAKDLARVKKDDNWLKRYLLHTDYKVDDAAKMLYATCKWRKENGINDLTHKDLPSSMLHSGLFFIRNQDKWGKKILNIKVNRFRKGIWKPEELRKAYIYYFERIERETNSDQITLFNDASNCGMANFDLEFSKCLADLINTHYPSLIHYSVTYEMPWYFSAAFKLTKALMSARTADTMVLTYKNDVHNYIDEANRQVDCGGTDNYTYSFEPEIIPAVQTIENQNQKPAQNQKQNQNSNPIQNQNKNLAQPQPQNKNKIQPQNQSKIQPQPQKQIVSDSSSDSDSDSDSESENENEKKKSDLKMKDLEDIHSEPSTVSIKTNNDSNRLIQVPERVVFTKDGAGKVSGKFQFQNNSSNDTLLFKMKTTAPEKFHVRPTIGLLEKMAVGTVIITVQPENLSSNLSSVEKERFQIQVAPAPKNLLNGLRSNKKELSDEIAKIWKNILSKDSQVETHLISCTLDLTTHAPTVTQTQTPNGVINNMSSPANPQTNAEQPLKTGDEMVQKFKQLEQRMDKMKTKLSARLAFAERLLYILLGLMIFLVIYLWQFPLNQIESSSENSSQNSCPVS